MPAPSKQSNRTRSAKGSTDDLELSPVESEIIHFFVQLASAFSIPKSIGEIFGVLFCAKDPLTFEQIVAKLGVSKGSASQGLRFLQRTNAVSTVYVARDRRTFYQAETSMRRLVSSMLNEGVRPHLDANDELLGRIEEMLEEDDNGGSDLIRERISTLQTWNRKARRLLPWLSRLTATKTPSE